MNQLRLSDLNALPWSSSHALACWHQLKRLQAPRIAPDERCSQLEVYPKNDLPLQVRGGSVGTGQRADETQPSRPGILAPLGVSASLPALILAFDDNISAIHIILQATVAFLLCREESATRSTEGSEGRKLREESSIPGGESPRGLLFWLETSFLSAYVKTMSIMAVTRVAGLLLLSTVLEVGWAASLQQRTVLPSLREASASLFNADGGWAAVVQVRRWRVA